MLSNLKNNWKWITDLHVKYKTVQFLIDNIRENLHNFRLSNDILIASLRREIYEIINC